MCRGGCRVALYSVHRVVSLERQSKPRGLTRIQYLILPSVAPLLRREQTLTPTSNIQHYYAGRRNNGHCSHTTGPPSLPPMWRPRALNPSRALPKAVHGGDVIHATKLNSAQSPLKLSPKYPRTGGHSAALPDRSSALFHRVAGYRLSSLLFWPPPVRFGSLLLRIRTTKLHLIMVCTNSAV